MSEFMAFVVAGLLGNLSFDSGPAALPQDKQAAAAPSGRPDLTEAQIKALRDKNIFAPFRTKPWPEPRTTSTGGTGTSSPRVEVPSRPKPPVLTGIVYDAASGAFQAVVEDKSDEKVRRLTGPRFLKAGDEVLGVKIESVQKDKVVVVLGETRKELGAGEPLPDTAPEGTPGAATPETPKVEAKPAEPAVVNSVLEELKKKNKKKDRTYDEP